MWTRSTGNRKQKNCGTEVGNGTWRNSDVDLASKSAFPWSQGVTQVINFFSPQELIISFLLFLFLVISPAEIKLSLIPCYCAIFVPQPCRSACVPCAEMSAGRETRLLSCTERMLEADRAVSWALAVLCGGFSTLCWNIPVIRLHSMCLRHTGL